MLLCKNGRKILWNEIRWCISENLEEKWKRVRENGKEKSRQHQKLFTKKWKKWKERLRFMRFYSLRFVLRFVCLRNKSHFCWSRLRECGALHFVNSKSHTINHLRRNPFSDRCQSAFESFLIILFSINFQMIINHIALITFSQEFSLSRWSEKAVKLKAVLIFHAAEVITIRIQSSNGLKQAIFYLNSSFFYCLKIQNLLYSAKWLFRFSFPI